MSFADTKLPERDRGRLAKDFSHHSCSALPSPAKDFGWHDPEFIHTVVMRGLNPSSSFSYRYGSDSVGWSDQIQF
ncbi:hypothetical protein ACFXTI_039912 [Malus domestica]